MQQTGYILKRNRGQKNIRMHFSDRGELIVSAPYFASNAQIEAFVAKNRFWIEKNMQKFPTHSYAMGDVVHYLGKACLLLTVKGSENRVNVLDSSILVTCRRNPDEKGVRKALQAFFARTLLDKTRDLVSSWAQKMRLEVPEIGISNAKTRWGVCYPLRRLVRFSIICATLPEDLIDYIVLHEMCHFVHADHSRAFWNLVSSYMPDADAKKARLRELEAAGHHRNLF